jgi:hypothetical protein
MTNAQYGVRRVHPFSSFLKPPRRPQDLRIACQRDVHAAREIMAALLEMGFKYGEPILNCPPNYVVEDPYAEPTHPVELSFVQRGDLLLSTTRPPLDDNDRKSLRESFTDLEQERLLPIWRRYFHTCSRLHVVMQPEICSLLRAPFDTRRQMKFYESEGAAYRELSSVTGAGWRKPPAEVERCTAAFLLRLDEAWPGGPGFIGAWGMDSTCTAVWAYRLGRDLRHLLEAPGFVMAELEISEIPVRPTNMFWANDWGVKVLVHQRLG